MNKMPMSSALKGVAGSSIVAKLEYGAVADGSYPLNETNFAGLGAHLPSFLLIVPHTAGNMTIEYAFDEVPTWIANSLTGAHVVFADGSATFSQIVLAGGPTDVDIFVLAQ